MGTFQPGLFDEPGQHSQYLEYHLRTASLESLRAALSAAVKPVEGANIAVAFGSACWDLLQPEWRPAQLRDFTTQSSPEGHRMPGTQTDLFVWIHGEDRGDIMQAVVQVSEALAPVTETALDLCGYKTRDARILTGFVDGTGNPKGDKRAQAALVPEGEAGAGGSYVIGQKWTHQLREFLDLSVTAQENVMGRTKETNIEMEGAQMPPDSHVARTDIDVDDVPMKIYRRGTPYGDATDKGLYFMALSCEQTRFEHLIDSMMGKDDGVIDAMMRWSDAHTGSYWFMPSQPDLEAMLAV